MLAGCQNHMRRTYPPYQPEPVVLNTTLSNRGHTALSPAPSVAVYAFGVSVGRAIHAGLSDPQQYSGQICSVRLRLSPAGKIISLSARGDLALCLALETAAYRATLPRPTENVLDKDGSLPPIDFRELPARE